MQPSHTIEDNRVNLVNFFTGLIVLAAGSWAGMMGLAFLLLTP